MEKIYWKDWKKRQLLAEVHGFIHLTQIHSQGSTVFPHLKTTQEDPFSLTPQIHVFIDIAGISNNLTGVMTANTKKWLHNSHHSQDPCWVHLSSEECTRQAPEPTTPRQLDCLKKPGLLLKGFVTCQVSQLVRTTHQNPHHSAAQAVANSC